MRSKQTKLVSLVVGVCGVDIGGGVGVGGGGGWGVFLLRDVEDGNLNHMMHWLRAPAV